MQNAPVLFETGAATHVGMVRQRNEDSFLARPEAGIWAVADGMGGHQDGDLASQMVIEGLKSIPNPTSASQLLTLCENRIFDANSRLKEIGRQRGGFVVGTTITVLLAFDGYFACMWSGDSRIYLARQGEISQISRDHTEVQDLLTKGIITPEQVREWPGSNVLTRAIGAADLPELETISGPLSAGDVFVICTDGLTHHVSNEEILRAVSVSRSQQACDKLITLALERGAIDNVTVIVVRYRPDDGASLPDTPVDRSGNAGGPV